MWRIWVGIGAVAWIATIAASAAINLTAGSRFGRTVEESYIFAALGVAADIWKAIGPVFILVLWRKSRIIVAGLASVVWATCFLFAVAAALGLAAQNRSSIVGGREATRISYDTTLSEIAETERRRAGITERRTPAEIESAIDVVMARPVREKGTVGTISRSCERDNYLTREACVEVAELRKTLSSALEASRLDGRLAALQRDANALRERGGTLASDPQAQLIARLSLGQLAESDVGIALVVLLVIVVELISALTPVVLQEYANSNRVESGEKETEAPRLPDVEEYLAQRIVPDRDGVVSLPALLMDFVDWCREQRLEVPSLGDLVRAIDNVTTTVLAGKVARTEHGYCGFRLKTTEPPLMLTAASR